MSMVSLYHNLLCIFLKNSGGVHHAGLFGVIDTQRMTFLKDASIHVLLRVFLVVIGLGGGLTLRGNALFGQFGLGKVRSGEDSVVVLEAIPLAFVHDDFEEERDNDLLVACKANKVKSMVKLRIVSQGQTKDSLILSVYYGFDETGRTTREMNEIFSEHCLTERVYSETGTLDSVKSGCFDGFGFDASGFYLTGYRSGLSFYDQDPTILVAPNNQEIYERHYFNGRSIEIAVKREGRLKAPDGEAGIEILKSNPMSDTATWTQKFSYNSEGNLMGMEVLHNGFPCQEGADSLWEQVAAGYWRIARCGKAVTRHSEKSDSFQVSFLDHLVKVNSNNQVVKAWVVLSPTKKLLLWDFDWNMKAKTLRIKRFIKGNKKYMVITDYTFDEKGLPQSEFIYAPKGELKETLRPTNYIYRYDFWGQ